MHCGSPGKLACYPTRIGRPSTTASVVPGSSRGSFTGPSLCSYLHHPPPTSTILHQPPSRRRFLVMSDNLPRLGGLSEPEKYERLVERVPGVWWSDAGPFAGLHELNALRVEYFRRVFGGFGGKRVLRVGCGGRVLSVALAYQGGGGGRGGPAGEAGPAAAGGD